MNTNLSTPGDGVPLDTTGPYPFRHPALPASAPSTYTIENLPLSYIIVRNKYVAELFDNFVRVSNTTASIALELGTLHQRYRDLCDKYDELKSEYHEFLHDHTLKLNIVAEDSDFSLSPSDSASQTGENAPVEVPATPTLVNQPVDRPEGYPQEVLWNLEDIRSCPRVKVNPHNKSRPPVHPCLRTATGSVVSTSQWIQIKHQATAIVREILHPLAKHSSDSSTFRKKYFKENWLKKWEEAMARIEAQQPILRLCSFHWKADLVLAHVLDTVPGRIKPALPSQPSNPAAQPLPQGTVSPPPPQAAPSSPLLANPSTEPTIISKRKTQHNTPVAREKKRRNNGDNGVGNYEYDED